MAQSLTSFSSVQRKQVLAWAYNNLDQARLAEFYKLARYRRPALSREEQLLIDKIGRKVQQEGGTMNGYYNYAPTMSGGNSWDMGGIDDGFGNPSLAGSSLGASADPTSQQYTHAALKSVGQIFNNFSNVFQPGNQTAPGGNSTGNPQAALDAYKKQAAAQQAAAVAKAKADAAAAAAAAAKNRVEQERAAKPKTNWTPWLIGGGVLAAGLTAAAVLRR